MNLFDKIKLMADEKNKSIAKIEKEAGIANGTISGWRSSKPLAETLARVARVLGTTVDELINV